MHVLKLRTGNNGSLDSLFFLIYFDKVNKARSTKMKVWSAFNRSATDGSLL